MRESQRETRGRRNSRALSSRARPLAALSGTWEGEKGADVAPGDDRGIEQNKLRERITFVPFGPREVHADVTAEGDRFSYEEDTVMRMPKRAEHFHHTDRNTLTRIG